MTTKEYKCIASVAADLSGESVEIWRLTLSQMLHHPLSTDDTRLLMREYNRLMVATSTMEPGEKVH